MKRLNLTYIDDYAANQYAFLPMPYLIIRHPAYKDLGYGEKILYTLMLNRLALSNQVSNKEKYSDANGRIYIIYTVDQVCEELNCSNKTAVEFLKNLTAIGLIERVRQGQGKPSLTYIKDFASVQYENSDANNMTSVGIEKNKKEQKCRNYTSRSVETTSLEVKKLHSSNIDNSNTNYNNLSIYLGQHKNICLSKKHKDRLLEEYGNSFDHLISEVSDRIFARTEETPIGNYYRYIKTIAQTLGIKTVEELKAIEERKRRDDEMRVKKEKEDTDKFYEFKMSEYNVSTRDEVDAIIDAETASIREKLKTMF